LDLAAVRDLRLRKMSKGMLQRLGLAQALLGEPDLLILDEPMSGLDPQGRKLVRDLILEQRHAGRTVLFSTHILSDVELVCTRAGILRDGRLDREMRLEELGRFGAQHVEVLSRGLNDAALERLAARATVATRTGSSVLFVVPAGIALHALVSDVIAAGGVLESVTPRRASLEEVFVGGTQAASSPASAAATDGTAVQPVAVAPAGRERVESGR
jgi:ABC-2 type transport system ATP-binding protein